MNPFIQAAAAVALALGAAVTAHADDRGRDRDHDHDRGDTREPKVMIISMFGPEGDIWLTSLVKDKDKDWRKITVPGLSPDYPTVSCNRNDVCVMTTGMGHSNAAASTMALIFSRVFDLSHTYFLISGIAGINPEIGTIGSVGWARYLVDFGIQWEIDAREIPKLWQTTPESEGGGGYLGINVGVRTTPWQPDGPLPGTIKPQLDYRTEVFQLNETLLQKAVALSSGVALIVGTDAQTARAKFLPKNPRDPNDPAFKYVQATLPPSVLQCDTLAGDTWFSGKYLGERATKWTELVTDGKGVYCTTQQEDNATYEALKRGASLKLVDLDRLAVLRGGSDFDRPAPGQEAVDNLLMYQTQGGFGITLQNLFLAGNPLVQAISTHWPQWRNGVPR